MAKELFPEFFSFRKSVPSTVQVETNRFYFVHQKKYISLEKLLRNQKRIKELFEF